VASTAAFQAGPMMAVYYASKAFVLSFSQAIAYELRKTGITVTALCPGPTITDFQNRAGVANSPLFKSNTMDAASVARFGYDAMNAGKQIAVPGFRNKALALGTRLVPRATAAKVAGKLNETRTRQ